MNSPMQYSTARTETAGFATNKVLRNTYLLLSMTLIFSSLTAGASMALKLPYPGIFITLIGYFGLLFLTSKFSNSNLGLLFVFALTGFMGYTLGPILNAYMSLANGSQTIMMAMGATGAIFIGLSVYVRVTRKDFSFMGGFLFVGILVAFLLGLGAIFLNVPNLSLAVSAMFVMLMAGLILFETSRIVNGGEANYIMATVTLYVSLFNMFTSLLHLFGVFTDE